MCHGLYILVQAISFEYFVEMISQACKTDYMKNILNDFTSYLDYNGHLPSWKYLLTVVNCSTTFHEVINDDVYMCPYVSGRFSFRRSKFFGAYKNKTVKYIHEIEAVVKIDINLGDGEVLYKNLECKNENLISKAKEKIKKYRIDENGRSVMQVFLLHNPVEVNFNKSTSGGLYGNKKYFKDIAKDLVKNNSQELANKLFNKSWKEFEYPF